MKNWTSKVSSLWYFLPANFCLCSLKIIYFLGPNEQKILKYVKYLTSGGEGISKKGGEIIFQKINPCNEVLTIENIRWKQTNKHSKSNLYI